MKIDYFKIINTFTKGTQSMGAATEGINQALKDASNAKNTNQTTVSVSQITVIVQNQDIKFNAIDRTIQAKLIKELMNIPHDIEALLSLLTFKKTSSESIENLLKQPNLKLDIDLIRQMLEGNSKESMSKLIKLFQQAPGGTQNTEQLKDILTLLSQFTPKKEATSEQILTNLTLLYLPWLPLSEKQELEIRIEKQKKQKEDETDQIVLVIYITTINLGRFKVSISLNKDFSVKISIENFEEESENTKEYLEQILKEISNQTKKDKVNAKLELLVCKSEEKATKEHSLSDEEREKKVIISPTKDVSPLLIITAQKISKIILEADEKISLLEKREKMASGES